MKKKTVFIAGGGTGGHLYPGLSVADAIKEKYPEIDIHFVGSKLGLETRIVPQYGYALHLLPAGKLVGKSLWTRAMTAIRMPVAFLKSFWILMRYRPVAVLGVGGFAAGPFTLMASVCGFRSAIWEPNAYPGFTNRFLSRFVGKAYFVLEESKKFLQCKDCRKYGYPVRKEVCATVAQQKKDGFHLLVFGGSQGARTLNNMVIEMAKSKLLDPSVKIVLQAGATDYLTVREKLSDCDQIELHEYLDDMGQRYSWADIVVCRAGMGTVAELAALKQPAVLVPLPTADNHQVKNAEALAMAGAAKIIHQEELSARKLTDILNGLVKEPQPLKEMGEKVGQFHIENAAERIAQDVLRGKE